LATLPELFEELKKYNPEDIFIVGGAMFYRTMLPYCDKAYVTKVDADGGARLFFENLDSLPDWELESQSEPVISNGHTIRFTVYRNNNPLKY